MPSNIQERPIYTIGEPVSLPEVSKRVSLCMLPEGIATQYRTLEYGFGLRLNYYRKSTFLDIYPTASTIQAQIDLFTATFQVSGTTLVFSHTPKGPFFNFRSNQTLISINAQSGDTLMKTDTWDHNVNPQLELLTARELEVLKALGRGLDNNEIGNELFISPNTVRNHIVHLMDKLDADKRVLLALIAERNELL